MVSQWLVSECGLSHRCAAILLLVIRDVYMLVVLVTVLGNLLVCLAIYKDSRLHRTENLFLASLAATDLLVAVLVMTFAAANDLLGYWVFGEQICDIWIAVDIMCSTASILNLCVVSLGRYFHIQEPFRYPDLMTKNVAITSITTIWIVSALISVLPVCLGHHKSFMLRETYQDISSPVCKLDLFPVYAISSSIISFYLPCLVMIIIYCRLYLYSRHHIKNISGLCPYSCTNEHKPAITIGVVMGIFLICWLPFFSLNTFAALHKNYASPEVFKVITWLGYSNSMFNPIVYSVFNSEFRDSFRLIMYRSFS